jgi:hypothetical protein
MLRPMPHRRPLVAAALGLGLAFACLSPPGLNGKVCTLDGGGCAPGELCQLGIAGHSLGLPGLNSGLCAPADSGCANLTCPLDAGLYICGGGTCFAAGAAELGGLPCWSGLGRCRAEGLYLWELDGGACLTGGANLPPQPECRLDAGHGLRCACDGVDNDCDGLVNDVPARPPIALQPQVLQGACSDDGGIELMPGDAGPLPGDAPQGGCALFDLGGTYAVASITLDAATLTQACGVAGGSTVFAQVFVSISGDAGFTLAGPVPGAGGLVAIGGRVERLAVCLPADTSHSPLRIRGASIALAQECDTLPSQP